MQRSSPVLLTRQSIALPMLDVLRGAGAPIGKVLLESGLPESFQEGGEGFIPFGTMLHFTRHAARSQDIPDLNWRGVLQAPTDHLGGWGRAVARAPTLRRAMLTFCERFAQDAPLMDLGIDVGDDHVWFWRRRPRRVIGWPGDEEGQQYALASLTRAVRGGLGPDWLPPRIRLESATAPWAAHIPALTGCQIDLSAPVVAIAIPYALLDRSNSWPNGPQSADPPTLPAAEETLAGSLRQAISALLPAVYPSLEVAAEIAERTPRTLRRHLAEEETSWRKVLEQARLDACQRLLLRDPERPLIEIAADLRFSDQASLTRAFRRWTGETPSDYRRRQG